MNTTRRTRRAVPRNPGPRGQWGWLALLVAALMVLGGCARLPQSGPVGTSEPLPGNENQVNYTFTPAGPADGASPEEASGSGETADGGMGRF